MVAGVHAVEAYLLYPQIYAYRLKLHPLIVMVILFIHTCVSC
jgi:predicted PurR-regulated permease PerM